MSQAELADLVGVRYQLVSDWERGVYTPRPSNVRKLCRALSCKREELEFNIPDPNPLAGASCLPMDDRQMERDSMIQRIIELEEQVKTGTTMLDDLVDGGRIRSPYRLPTRIYRQTNRPPQETRFRALHKKALNVVLVDYLLYLPRE